MTNQRRQVALLAVPVLCIGCAASDLPDNRTLVSHDSVPSLDAIRCIDRDETQPCALFGVSIYELITRPREWHGKRVRVIGYANLHDEGSHLYASAADWRRNIAANGISLEVPAARLDSLNGRDVMVEATFIAHSGGLLRQITHFESWESKRNLRLEEIPEIDLSKPVR
jgi:hypothetical protein